MITSKTLDLSSWRIAACAAVTEQSVVRALATHLTALLSKKSSWRPVATICPRCISCQFDKLCALSPAPVTRTFVSCRYAHDGIYGQHLENGRGIFATLSRPSRHDTNARMEIRAYAHTCDEQTSTHANSDTHTNMCTPTHTHT